MWLVSFFFFSSRRRHTRLQGDWSSDVCSSDLQIPEAGVTPCVGICSNWLQKICAPATTLLSAEKVGPPSAGGGPPKPALMAIPTFGVFTSLLAIEIPSMLFPCALVAAYTEIPAPPIA